jgi:hypothetical protein
MKVLQAKEGVCSLYMPSADCLPRDIYLKTVTL